MLVTRNVTSQSIYNGATLTYFLPLSITGGRYNSSCRQHKQTFKIFTKIRYNYNLRKLDRDNYKVESSSINGGRPTVIYAARFFKNSVYKTIIKNCKWRPQFDDPLTHLTSWLLVYRPQASLCVWVVVMWHHIYHNLRSKINIM